MFKNTEILKKTKRKHLQRAVSRKTGVGLNISSVTKRLIEETNCKELTGFKPNKGIVMLFKGKM